MTELHTIGIVSPEPLQDYITVMTTKDGLYQVNRRYLGLYRTLVKMAFASADYQTLKVTELVRSVLQTDISNLKPIY